MKTSLKRREQIRTSGRALTQKRIAEGLCYRCGSPRTEYAARCNECEKKHREYEKARKRATFSSEKTTRLLRQEITRLNCV